MRRLALVALAAAAALGADAGAQVTVVPAPPYYAMPPTMPLTPYAAGPVQQQVLQNYRTQLQQAQREMLHQNPAGLGRDQIEVNRQLNAYKPAYQPPPATLGSMPVPGFSPAPFSASGIVSPPFNAGRQP